MMNLATLSVSRQSKSSIQSSELGISLRARLSKTSSLESECSPSFFFLFEAELGYTANSSEVLGVPKATF